VATITVRGEGAAPGQPDEIVVALELSAVRAAAQDAYDEVAAQSDALNGLCDELGIAGAARSTAGVSVQEHREYDDRGRPEPRGYVASNRVLVRVADAVLVSRLLREAVTRSAARVSGPWWRLAAENPARAEACGRAARDARRKAEAYADALGRRLGAIVEVREPAASPVGGGRSASFGALMAAEPEIPVSPGELDVRAAVEVTFALEDA
jgi:uncharacterized protein YggE